MKQNKINANQIIYFFLLRYYHNILSLMRSALLIRQKNITLYFNGSTLESSIIIMLDIEY